SVYAAFRASAEPPSWEGQPPRGGKTKTLHETFPFLAGKTVDWVIWTTTSWTLVANEAIALHPSVSYVFYALPDRVIVVAKELLPAVLRAIAPAQLTSKEAQLPGQPQAHQGEGLTDPTRILG